MPKILLALLCFVPSLAWGQGVKLPAEIKVPAGIAFIIAPEITEGWGQPKWDIPEGLFEQRLDLLFPPEIAKQARGKIFAANPGRYPIKLWNAKKDSPEGEVSDVTVCIVTVGTPPVDPVVVDPVVDPDKPPPRPPGTPTAATYIYEKDDHAIPAPVASALNKINREKKIVASVFEQDTVDGTGKTPDQYTEALAFARAAGLPALVVTSGKNVLRVLKDPKTEAAVLEAVK